MIVYDIFLWKSVYGWEKKPGQGYFIPALTGFGFGLFAQFKGIRRFPGIVF